MLTCIKKVVILFSSFYLYICLELYVAVSAFPLSINLWTRNCVIRVLMWGWSLADWQIIAEDVQNPNVIFLFFLHFLNQPLQMCSLAFEIGKEESSQNEYIFTLREHLHGFCFYFLSNPLKTVWMLHGWKRH